MVDPNESSLQTKPPLQGGDEPPVLPPVEPPTASFLVQLFFVPMVIVTVIVLVWLAFSWLAQRGENPQKLVADLERLDKGAWQRAYRLVEELRLPQNEDLRNDVALATQLADILDRQMKAAEIDEQRIWLRMFVARSLGLFDVDVGVPVLIEAAAQQTRPEEVGVRRAALQSLGVLAGKQKVGAENLRGREGLPAALKAAAEAYGDGSSKENLREHGQVRSTAAFVMGLVGGEESIEKLTELLDDHYPDVRYNAATGLARHGDQRAIKRLLEMLQIDNPYAVEYEEDEGEHDWKQAHVQITGLMATQKLIEANPDADIQELRAAVKRLAAAKVNTAVKTDARETLLLLDDDA